MSRVTANKIFFKDGLILSAGRLALAINFRLGPFKSRCSTSVRPVEYCGQEVNQNSVFQLKTLAVKRL